MNNVFKICNEISLKCVVIKQTAKYSFKSSDFDITWYNKLPLPLSVESSVKQGHLIPRIGVEYAGISTLQGRRNENEDRMIVKQITKNVLMMAMFDGHAQPTAANFCQHFMENSIKFWLLKKFEGQDLKTVLYNSFLDCNNLLAHHLWHYCPLNHRKSGTTATVALLRNNIELAVGHVGDSRAILSRKGRALRLSTDDDPGNETEQHRILSSGGLVSTNSLGVPIVNGRLGMTRSLGDLDLKRFGVVPYPHLYNIKISHSRDGFIVLVSDGISYVMSDQEMVNSISGCIDPKSAAIFLTDQALQYGSEDNVSALIVPFGSWGKYSSNNKQMMTQSMGFNRSKFVINNSKRD